MKLCPTCGRRPSERHGWDDPNPPCDDPVHDEADLGPEAIHVLGVLMDGMTREEADRIGSDVPVSGDLICAVMDAAHEWRLSRLPGAAQREGGPECPSK